MTSDGHLVTLFRGSGHLFGGHVLATADTSVLRPSLHQLDGQYTHASYVRNLEQRSFGLFLSIGEVRSFLHGTFSKSKDCGVCSNWLPFCKKPEDTETSLDCQAHGV